MKIINLAGSPIELFWVNIFQADRPLVKQTERPIRNSTNTNINSYDTHTFAVKFLKPPHGADPQVTFSKGPKQEVITISYTPEMGMTFTQVTKYDEVLIKVKAITDLCFGLKGDKFDKCFANGYEDVSTKLEESTEKVTMYRDLMSSRLRNYTCDDDSMVTSKAISNSYFYQGDQSYKIDVLFDLPSAKIWAIEDFISDEECSVLQEHGITRLERATVSGEDGSSVVSENRKAQQAGYNAHQHDENDPLYPLYLRILGLTNQHAGYNLQPPGQEDFTIIQYNKDDQYTPHCDGDCAGNEHAPGGRVATAVMYCQVAERGGATTFTKTDVFVKPKKGMATFFSYKGPDGKMDTGLTEHSGCPVLEGEKWITTMWMREGVTKEDPWDKFDPTGKRMNPEDNAANHGNYEAADLHLNNTDIDVNMEGNLNANIEMSSGPEFISE
eukprot:CAMPEP_0119035372 /NCGR_PEP_ID=MMETSP1177-20130426/2288_1 /TAXON_ID=2985 /ORGANISM="Ochromonas sp, Strain CCMP1899" /LENGTH=440 /DNA_ID=CAMNT_0006993457 /DNA_START=206 /DNA_END=1528 /DNA_ORIENTATION=-